MNRSPVAGTYVQETAGPTPTPKASKITVPPTAPGPPPGPPEQRGGRLSGPGGPSGPSPGPPGPLGPPGSSLTSRTACPACTGWRLPEARARFQPEGIRVHRRRVRGVSEYVHAAPESEWIFADKPLELRMVVPRPIEI